MHIQLVICCPLTRSVHYGLLSPCPVAGDLAVNPPVEALQIHYNYFEYHDSCSVVSLSFALLDQTIVSTPANITMFVVVAHQSGVFRPLKLNT